MKEQRRLLRYFLEIPVAIRWRTPAGWQQRLGTTRNMNTQAVYVEASDSLPHGTAVRVDCILRGPAARRQLQLSGFGEVLRCELLVNGGFGLVIRAKTRFKISRFSVETPFTNSNVPATGIKA